WCVGPVVIRIPLVRLRWSRRRAFVESREIRICRLWNLEVAGEDIEHATHVRCALNVRMSAQSVNTAAGASDVSQQQLQHRRGANDLRAEGVLRPTDGIDDR